MNLVIYYRVSTDKQERSGLGVEAQKAAVRDYVKRTGDTVIGRYAETESGRLADRPQLARALAHARRSRAKLIVAKLDRLLRNLAFLDALQSSNVNFAALDCEFATKPMLQMLMVMAEYEADQASTRTRAALAARRERGKPLGAENPRCRNLSRQAMAEGRRAGVIALQQAADEAYADLLPGMVTEREAGSTLAEVADRLNSYGQTTRTGRPWTAGTVANVLRRSVTS